MLHRILYSTVVLLGIGAITAADEDYDLVPLKHNQKDLVVDLGVGLWAHPLPMDFDGDGDNDLVVSCPDKPFNGTYFFENSSGDMKLPVFEPPVRIGPGYHSIRVSYVGDRVDVMTAATIHQDFPKHRFDKPIKVAVPGKVAKAKKTRANQWHRVDWDNDGDHDLVIGLGIWDNYGWDDAWDSNGVWKNGPLHGHVFLVTNDGSDNKPKWGTPRKIEAGGTAVDVYGWPSPCVADFDGDGDRDLICGEFVDRFTWFENTGTDSVIVLAPGKRVVTDDGAELQMDLEMIVPTPIDWDKDGDVDLIVGDEDGRVAFVENVTSKGILTFKPPVYFRQKADWLKFGALATPYCTDWDGDGDTDILCGNTAGYIGFFENKGGVPNQWAAPQLLKSGSETLRIMAGPNGSIQGPCEAKWGYTTLSAADWDGDGRTDILANSIWGKIVWYRNLGPGDDGRPRLSEAESVTVEWPDRTPKPSWTWWNPVGKELVTQWRTTPEAVDFNADGLMDLVMLDREGYLSFFERTRDDTGLHLQPGRRIFENEKGEALRLNSKSAGGSGRRKLHVVDWDGDGDLDLLTNSTNADLYENMGRRPDGNVTFQHRGAIGQRKLAGHTSSPASIDVNNNGRLDLLIGAEDGHLYLMTR
ncbi:MAG TPA: VCBS repeat-containing protein [Planctomycetes bacterium]|nr:VCBS repeat-containing protein [Fuerstiella sp.]HIK92958.1 VCBS repeat-containing protein [Planctomycetota bacterium]